MKVSVVVPFYNEEKNVKPLYSQLSKSLKKSEVIDSFEFVFVDDGSIDDTAKVLNSIKDKTTRVVSLKKNTGKTNALKQGFNKAKFDTIVILDGDLQNDPSDIDGMLIKLAKGYDCVCGWRYNRNDPFLRKISSKIANSVRRFVLKDNFHDIACGIKVFRKKCLKSLVFFEGAYRFFPFLIQNKGFKVTEYKVKHHPRKYGEAKYNIRNRVFKSIKDMIKIRRLVNEN